MNQTWQTAHRTPGCQSVLIASLMSYYVCYYYYDAHAAFPLDLLLKGGKCRDPTWFKAVLIIHYSVLGFSYHLKSKVSYL